MSTEMVSSHHNAATTVKSGTATAKQANDLVYMDSDFWYHKGVVLNGKDQNKSAVQCYLQALEIDPRHLPSIFNLACKYQQLKQLPDSKHWFSHAIDVNPNWPDALYGLCLVNIELGCPADAVKYIRKAIQV
jgi:tetratricopeptide (TPR) repeat protein